MSWAQKWGMQQGKGLGEEGLTRILSSLHFTWREGILSMEEPDGCLRGQINILLKVIYLCIFLTEYFTLKLRRWGIDCFQILHPLKPVVMRFLSLFSSRGGVCFYFPWICASLWFAMTNRTWQKWDWKRKCSCGSWHTARDRHAARKPKLAV